jgi:hypothetical protein
MCISIKRYIYFFNFPIYFIISYGVSNLVWLFDAKFSKINNLENNL